MVEAEERSLTLGRALARALRLRGVRYAAGMAGGELIPLLQAFAEEDIKLLLCRQEGSAGFLAGALWLRGGAPGLCFATMGPGACNLVMAAAESLLERSRMVLFTGRADPELVEYTHQVFDQVELFSAVTRRSVGLVPGTAWLQALTALRGLDTGAPGPVHFDLWAELAQEEQPERIEGLLEPKGVRLAPEGPVAEARDRIRASRRPILIVGLGVLERPFRQGLSEVLVALAEELGCPVLSTYKAKGLFPEDHPLSLGCFGLSPVVDRLVAAQLRAADLLITVGFDPVELRSGWLNDWPGQTERIDIAPFEEPPIWGREGLRLGGLPVDTLRALLGVGVRRDGEVVATAHRSAVANRYEEPISHGPARSIRAIQAGAPDNVLVAVDVGAHRICLSHVWICREGATLVQSNGLCAMGSALPAAIGLKLADPDRPALAIMGDGGLLMALGELGLAADLALDLVVVVLVDRALGLIALKQSRERTPEGAPLAKVGMSLGVPEPGPLAAAFGGEGRRVKGEEAVTEAVRDAFAKGGLQLIFVEIDPASYAQQM